MVPGYRELLSFVGSGRQNLSDFRCSTSRRRHAQSCSLKAVVGENDIAGNAFGACRVAKSAAAQQLAGYQRHVVIREFPVFSQLFGPSFDIS
jgi:hypothetical protein